MPEPSTPRIFVSYARSDGKAFARGLRRRLSEEHGFSLWHDLADMEGGRDWWRQIEAAIRAVEYLVLVMTPAALRSDYVRREWRLARELGVCVIPVKAAPGLDYSGLPRWMRRAHFVDTEAPEQWTRFVRTLEGPCRAPRVPFMAGDPPPDYIPRPEEYRALRDRLLDPERGEPVAITAALRGAGGYGKTTLATALCHDPDVQDAFHDGVLWVTLGERPGDLTARVEDLIATLTGERPGFASIEAAMARLAESLADRALLLVIDDVWNAAHLRPFLQGGPNCARLITTRDGDTLPADAREVPVDAMKTAEAVDLLRHGLPDGDGAAFDALAARLGEWPLLLKLVNGALRARVNEQRQPLAQALGYVNRALDRHGITAFDARDAASRDQAVARTLAVSLDHLAEHERARFRELAVFPEDVDVPLAAVEALWGATAGLDDLDTEDLCGLLRRRSLLLHLDLDARCLRLHDVVRRYLEQEAADRLPALHRHLIESYRARCPDGWWSASDDGYFFEHLPWHLKEAREMEHLRELLFDFRWLRTKLAATSVAELIADYGRLPRDDEEASRLAAALRLSAHVLAVDPSQLAGQLYGRLVPENGAEVARLLAEARRDADRPALLPRRATLTRPGAALVQTFPVDDAWITALAILPDRRRALWAAIDGPLHLWDLGTGLERRRFEDHTSSIRTMAVLPGKEQVFVGCQDGTVRLLDLQTGAELRRIEGFPGPVRAIAPHAGRVLCLNPYGDDSELGDRALILCDFETAREQWRSSSYDLPVEAVAISGDGLCAVLGQGDKTVRVWDLDERVERWRLTGHTSPVTAVAVAPDGRRAVSGGGRRDRTLRVWDLESGIELRRFGECPDWITAVTILPDGQQALSASGDRMLRFWQLYAPVGAPQSEGHAGPVGAVAVSSDGRLLMSGGKEDGTLHLWDAGTGLRLRTIKLEPYRETSSIAILPDGKKAISCSWGHAIRQWNLETGEELPSASFGRIPKVVTLLPGGSHALAGTSGGMLRLWNVETGEGLRHLVGHDGEIVSVAVVGDGRKALSASADHTLRLWDLGTCEEIQRFEPQLHWMTTMAVSPDGRRALSGGHEGSLRLWDLRSGEEVCLLEARPERRVNAVAVLADGRRGLSAAEDRVLRLWDLDVHTQVGAFTGEAAFTCLALTPDGRSVVAGDTLGNLHLLDILL